jgi:hypothetical protein
MEIFAVSFLSQLAAGKSAAPTARRGGRDDKEKGDARWKVVAGRRDIFVTFFLSPGFRDPGVNICSSARLLVATNTLLRAGRLRKIGNCSDLSWRRSRLEAELLDKDFLVRAIL